jgi:hypothetical protein
MTARKKRPARDDATPEKIKSGRKTGKTPSKDRPYRAILRQWAFRPYIEKYPDSDFKSLAEIRLIEIGAAF